MKKRLIALIAAILMSLSFTVYAIAQDMTDVNFELSDDLKDPLLERAMEYGIDISGLSDRELIAVVKEKEYEKFVIEYAASEKDMVLPQKMLKLSDGEKETLFQKAEKYGMDITGLTDEEIFELVLTKDNEAMVAKAKNAGIDTEGLTPAEVLAKVNEYDQEAQLRKVEEDRGFILDEALRLQIDTEGLEFEEIKAKVYEKLMPELILTAEKLKIDYTGLDYRQLLKKVKEKQIEIWNNTETFPE